jgi:alcohol dehydrogenase (cytochrome c)
MTIKQWLLSTLVGSTCLISIAAVAGPIENYSPVTADRLNNPEPGNWMLYRRTYDGQGYSPLDQINTSNVKNLTPVWTFSTGVIEGHEAPPIVNNGVMFVATPMG